MKLGWCPGCRRWLVLVRHQRCTCGQGHQQIGQFSNCPKPKATWAIRRHDCGQRVEPIRVRELEGTA